MDNIKKKKKKKEKEIEKAGEVREFENEIQGEDCKPQCHWLGIY